MGGRFGCPFSIDFGALEENPPGAQLLDLVKSSTQQLAKASQWGPLVVILTLFQIWLPHNFFKLFKQCEIEISF